MKSDRKITIHDIAEETGVSASSVSRVLNNKPGVNKKNRKLVQDAIQKYGFSPNAVAQGLINSTSKLIGILVEDVRLVYHTEQAYYIERSMAEKGYSCIIVNTGIVDDEKVAAIYSLEKRRVDAAVMIGSTFQSKAVKSAITKHFRDIPVIMVNGEFDLPNTYCVISDEKSAVGDSVAYLADKGKKNIVFMSDSSKTPSSKAKTHGYLEAIEKLGMASVVVDGSENNNEAYKKTTEVLKKHPKTDAIIYATDLMAVEGVKALTKAGITIPEEISVIGINDSVFARMVNPELTTIDNKRIDLGIVAVHMLADCLNGIRTTKRVVLPCTLTVRESA